MIYIYQASAGAGKTFTLVIRYLSVMLTAKGGYRTALAVTFTNKATAEIKERILRVLYGLSSLAEDQESKAPEAVEAGNYLEHLSRELSLPPSEICDRARTALKDLLFDYSFFSVHTIDSFFQRVMREFARETGLPFGYAIELDNRQAVTGSVDRMLEEVNPGIPLFGFLIDFIDRFSEEGKWDIRTKLIREGNRVFSEKFAVPETEDPLKVIGQLQKELYGIIHSYESRVRELGKRGMEILRRHGMVPEDFNYKAGSVPSIFPKMTTGTLHPKKRFAEVLEAPEKLLGAKDRQDPVLLQFVQTELVPLLQEIARFYRARFPEYVAARLVTANLDVYGVQLMLRDYIHQWIREENRFLIAEVNRFLKGIIGNNELPFVYEKIGQHFLHYLIDEFQDTSHFQYHNLKPLLKDSVARGHISMLVGDIKQSIFRWRNSDWAIMAQELPADFSPEQLRYESLDMNFRSRENIVRFNNAFFRYAPEVMAGMFAVKVSSYYDDQPLLDRTDTGEYTRRITTAYAFDKLRQKMPDHKNGTGGYVYLRMFDKKEYADWTAEASAAVCRKVSELITEGIPPGEIALLVRKNEEGARMVRDLYTWQTEHPDTPSFPVISDDALSLEQSAAVRLVIHFFQFLENPDDLLVFGNFYHAVQRLTIPMDPPAGRLTDAMAEELSGRERWRTFLPGLDDSVIDRIAALPLPEMIRETVRHFGLGDRAGEVPFLYALENKALDHLSQGGAGLSSFLDWWEEQGRQSKIPMPEGLDAVRVMTIYKAKGLGMDVVILPFADWAFEISGGNTTDQIWCHTDKKPLSLLPSLPVPVKNDMVHTVFSGDFLSEKIARYMDNLNLIYVSMTRAISRLYVFAARNSGSERTGYFIDRVLTAIKANAGSGDVIPPGWSEPDNEVTEFGEVPPPVTVGSVNEPLKVTGMETEPLEGRLRFKPHGRNYFLLDRGGKAEKIDEGNLYHELLARIYVSGDEEKSVRRAVCEGLIPESDEKRIVAELKKIISFKDARDWFSGSWEVYNERTLIRPEGKLHRPDRVMIKGREVVVVDYKFGDKEESYYRTQVKNYIRCLQEAGYSSVKGVVWYVKLERMEIIDADV